MLLSPTCRQTGRWKEFMSSKHTRWKEVFTHNIFPPSLVSLLLSFLPPEDRRSGWMLFMGGGVCVWWGGIRGSLRVFEVGQQYQKDYGVSPGEVSRNGRSTFCSASMDSRRIH